MENKSRKESKVIPAVSIGKTEINLQFVCAFEEKTEYTKSIKF